MIRRVAELAGVLLMLGAASAAPASDPSYLGNWARGDGKTHIRVEPCGKSVCGVNTWVRPGMKHEKVGDRLIFKVKPSGASRWTRQRFRSPAQSTLHSQGPRRQYAHDNGRMRHGRPDVPEHELDAPRPFEIKFEALSSEPETAGGDGCIDW